MEYPVKSIPRYGYGKPAHQKLSQIIDKNREQYQQTLISYANYHNSFDSIPFLKPEPSYNGPYWRNGFISGLDAISMYSFLVMYNPENFFEIGSGNSTKFARKAITDHRLQTKITSFDPYPRSEIDDICDRIVREPVENTDLKIFQELKAGDLLFVDNSHRSAMNTDVTVVFLDILPYLKQGVLVGFHDIFLPYDYPAHWAKRFYSEQYLLAAYLLAEGERVRIVLPNFFIGNDPELASYLPLIWSCLKPDTSSIGGGAFWIRTS